MLFEIINPSDPVTLEHDDPVVAAAATLLLGNGMYGLDNEDGTSVLPVMVLGGKESLEYWLREHNITDFSEYVAQYAIDIADCLETVMVCRPSEHRALTSAIEASGGDRAEAFKAFNEERRSSMNDICGRALMTAHSLRSSHRASHNPGETKKS